MSDAPTQLSCEDYQWQPQLCPICEVAPTRFVGRRGGAAHRAGLGVECQIWQCSTCGLVFPNPMPIPRGGLEQHYNVEANEYFRHHDIDTKGQFAATMLERAARLTSGKGCVLDVGAGRGELLRIAKKEGWATVGVEPSPFFAEYARKHSGAEILCQSIEDCRFPAAAFDVIFLSAVLEHLYQPNETIRALSAALRPGGALFLDVPNERGLYFRVGNLYQKLRRRDWTVNLAPTFEPFHVFGFSPYALRRLLDKHGFNVAEWRVYPGRSVLPHAGGLASTVEMVASHIVTTLSRIDGLGTYIEAWAVKK